jgi:hypothetical protein
MKKYISGNFLLAGALLGAIIGLMPMTAHAEKVLERKSPPYTVMVALEVTSPFVGDGRMNFANLAFSTTFKDLIFVFDPGAILGFCSVEGEEGKILLTRHEFNDVQEGDDRHRPWVKKEWPMEFPASLSTAPDEMIENTPTSDDGLPLVPLAPPSMVKLRFHAEFGLLDLKWYSKLGSNVLSDMSFDFDVPWPQLLEGKPLTLKLPYQADYAEEKGEWWIEFIPKGKK